MSTNFLDKELEERVQAHFTGRYGEPPDADEVWNALSTQLGPQGGTSRMTSQSETAAITKGPRDTWMSLPGEIGPHPRPRYEQAASWRSFAMAASVVLALGVIIAGAMGLAYMFNNSTPQPRAGEPTGVPSPQPTLQSTELLGQTIAEISPYDWSLAHNIAGNHEKGVDTAVTYNGKPSAYLKSTSPGVGTDAQLSKLWNTEGYAGKRVRFSAYVKSQDVEWVAGLWAQLESNAERLPAFDGVGNVPIEGTTEWRKYSLTIDLPPDSPYIPLGLLLSGGGQVWIADARIKLLDRDASAPAFTGTVNSVFNPGFEWGPIGWGWGFSRGSAGYEMVAERGQAHSGDTSLRMRSKIADPGDAAISVQTIGAREYAGKRIRVSGYLKSEQLTDHAILTVNGYSSNQSTGVKLLASDSLNDRRVRGTTDWRRYDLVIDLPDQATHIEFGTVMEGEGTLWADDFEIEVVGQDVTVTGISLIGQPSNLGFEEGLLDWGRTGWFPVAYDYSADTSGAYEGKASSHLKSKSPFEGGDKYTLLEQYVDAGQFAGKRVRVIGYVKGQDVSGIAGLFLRQYAAGNQSVVDLSRLEGQKVTSTSDWRKYEAVMDVPADSYAISYGLSITGEGEVWLDAVVVEVVGSEVPITAPPEPLTP